MEVAVEDVIRAGGDIRGLPAKDKQGREGLIVFVTDHDGFTTWCVAGIEGRKGDVWTGSEFKVYADGIRILDIGSRLYRVTGHKDYGPARFAKGAILEPLIPDKPEPKVEPLSPAMTEFKEKQKELSDLIDRYIKDMKEFLEELADADK